MSTTGTAVLLKFGSLKNYIKSVHYSNYPVTHCLLPSTIFKTKMNWECKKCN